MVNHQRKFRNLEERTAICDQIKENMDKANLRPSLYPCVQSFFDIIDEFKNSTNSRCFNGIHILEDLDLQIEYYLPGRRILPHYSKITKRPKQDSAQSLPTLQ